MEVFYSKIGDVQDILVHNYEKYKINTSFLIALRTLRESGRLLRRKPETPAYFEPLPDEAFRQTVLGLPVNASQIMQDALNTAVITEQKTIPDDKDVFNIMHMAHVDERLHAHNYFEINYVYSGSCVQIFENERRTLHAGDICIISPFAQHNVDVLPDSLALGILMRKSTFDKIFLGLLTDKGLLSTFFRHALYENNASNYLFLRTDNGNEIKHLLQNLVLECHTPDSYANTVAVSLINMLFARVLRAYSGSMQMYSLEPQLRREFDFSLLLQYIQQNYQTVTLGTLAETFHYSEAYLCKQFKKNLGKSFTTITQGLKMQHAAEALRGTALKVHEVSENVGYDSVDHFSRTFKKVYGLSPLEYRKKLQGHGMHRGNT